MTEHGGYADWRSLELAIKDAANKAAQQAGPGTRLRPALTLAAMGL